MKDISNRLNQFLIKGIFLVALLSVINNLGLAQGHIVYTCSACHIFHNAPGGALTAVDGNANLCISCHNPTGTASGLPLDNSDKAIPGTSGTSHAWGELAINASYETNTPTNPEMMLRLPDGNIICSTCHDQHVGNTIPNYLRISNEGDAMCKDCHSARDVGRYADDNINYKGSHPIGLAYPTGNIAYKEPPTGSVLLPGGNIECSSCHQVHYSATTDGYLLRQTNDDALCASCHTYTTHESMGCSACHQTHNTDKANIYLISNIVSTPNSGDKTVLFTEQTGPNSGADGDSNYDGICEVCHTSTNYHKNDGTGASHNAGSNCMSCHPHEDSFAPTGCEDCHIATFPEWGTADGHFAHTTKYQFECSTCHYQYGSGGDLEGSHPSGGAANVAFDPSGLVYRNGADSNTPSYNGDKTCGNIYCHSDGKSAYRGTDGVLIWGARPPDLPIYTLTPPWNSIVGTISSCDACHSGVGNMTGDYTITTPGPADPEPPNYGGHRRTPHKDNDQELEDSGWTQVNCFWCHNANNGDYGDNGSPVYQGTYGTSWHVDGATYFDPRSFVDGGTIVNNPSGGSFSYSYLGTEAHCGGKQSCW